MLVGNSYISPKGKLRWIYFIFILVWGCLLSANYFGVKVQRNYLALKLLQNVDAVVTKTEMNANLWCQIQCMEWALGFIAVWLLLYLFWWILCDEAAAMRSK